jgi:CheY-like chemotaxis protein
MFSTTDRARRRCSTVRDPGAASDQEGPPRLAFNDPNFEMIKDASGMTIGIGKQPGSILVVEDDVCAMEALTELLEDSGYTVLQADNGEKALEVAKSSPQPGLVLLDLSMPVMDGWEFMRHKRREPTIADIPVVVITALVSAIPAGAIALLTKPIDGGRLMMLVERYCLESSS